MEQPRGRRQSPGSFLHDWDLMLLLGLILADIRLFKGSSVASFTMLECFAWGYCFPVMIGYFLQPRRTLAPAQTKLIMAVGIYVGWVVTSALAALIARGHSDVLQEAKNVVFALPITGFVSIRLSQSRTVSRLLNLYVLYCIAACAFALLQLRTGGPYFRPVIENNDYKLDYAGEVVSNVVLGFSGTPNELALVVLPGAMFSIVKLVSELRYSRVRLPTLLCCAMTSLVLVLAQSRGAIVWFVFGAFMVVGPLRHSRSIALKVGLVFAVISMLVVYGLRTEAVAADVDNTIRVRVLLWLTSLDAMVNDVYVLGLGDGMRFVLSQSWRVAGWEFPDAHNGWLDQVLFFGTPALILYFLVWRCFLAITDAAAASRTLAPQSTVLLDGIRGTVLAYMGLYFFEPVAAAVFPVSQLSFLVSCGVGLSCLPKMSADAGGRSLRPSRNPFSPAPQGLTAAEVQVGPRMP